MKNIIKVSDFMFPNMKDLLSDYFLYLISHEESMAHSLLYTEEEKEHTLTQIVKLFLEVANTNDSYIICADMDDICEAVESDRLIFGNKLITFNDFDKVEFSVVPFWPKIKSVHNINKILDKCHPMFIVIF